MAPLDIAWIATAALAICLGWAGPKSLKAAVAVCVLVGFAGWAASYFIMLVGPTLGGDIELAENYINGSSGRSAAIEIGVALGWTFVWFGLARFARLVIRHRPKRAS